MRKMTRLALISAIFVTSGLTAKIATENYKAVVDNDERIHKAYELAKKPNKAAVLEAIVDAANAEPDERIRDAVVIEPEKPNVVRIKTKVTTSAGVSPITSVMDKKDVNKAEEFIGKIPHPVSIPDCNIPVQEIVYETKDIFPTFEEAAEEVAIIMYGWNYPWVMTWTKGETTTEDADGNQLPSPVDHSSIIANIEKYSDDNGLTHADWEDRYISDGVFTYHLNDESYERTYQYPVDSTGKDLDTFPLTVENGSFDYVQEINGTVRYENPKYIFKGSYDKYGTVNAEFELPVEGNAEIGFYAGAEKYYNQMTRMVVAIFGDY